MRGKTTQLSVMAVAALAVFAVAAVMLLSGGNPAQADTASLAPEDGDGHLLSQPKKKPTPTPEPTTPPTRPPHKTPITTSCPYGDVEVDSGHLPLFDVYWDTETQNLATSHCPSKFIYPNGPEAEEERTRRGFNVNIDETIVQIDNKYKQTLAATTVENSTDRLKPPTTYGVEPNRYWFLGNAGDEVWILPVCPEGELLAAGDICIGFSSELLNREDWNDLDFEFESVREPYSDTEHEGFVYVFRHHARVDTTVEPQPVWNGTDPDANEIQVHGGEHRHRYWAFTKPGTYVLGVHVKAHPNPDVAWGSIKPGYTTVTSEVKRYTFHVGDRADLAVGYPDYNGNQTFTITNADPTDTTFDPGDNVKIRIDVENRGPDTANDAEVEVDLPAGLTYASATTTIGNYNSNTGIWSLGDVAASEEGTIAGTLIITAQIAQGAQGREQKVTAHIYATDPDAIAALRKLEMDPHVEDNTAMASITAAGVIAQPPVFAVSCTVTENADAGTEVCGTAQFMLKGVIPPTGLAFALEGSGAEKFTVKREDDGAVRVKVADGPGINYEDAASYDLALTLADGWDDNGNREPEHQWTVDNRIGLWITVTDVADETLSVTLNADPTAQTVNENVVLTGKIVSPVATDSMSVFWFEGNIPEQSGNPYGDSQTSEFDPSISMGRWVKTYESAARREYKLTASYTDAQSNLVSQNAKVIVTWQAAQ